MRKFILFSVTCFILSSVYSQVNLASKDASSRGTFSNFTATDMMGVSHNIQAYLDNGKYVVVNFFCAWDEASWDYHQSGILQTLFQTYGYVEPNEFVVLLVENETSNTMQQIFGVTNTEETIYAGFSQGDFTNNMTNPVPIIDATSNLASHISLYNEQVPAVYLFCPSGYVYDIYDLERFDSATAIYDFAIASCNDESNYIGDVDDGRVMIFPNPTSGIISIPVEGVNKVIVSDMKGVKLRTLEATGTIDISDLDMGVYIIAISTKNGYFVKKIIKR